MQKTSLIASTALLSLTLSACLGLPEKTKTDETAPPAAVTETSVETAPGTPVSEDTDATPTLAGCPEIPEVTIDIENPIPDTAAEKLLGLTETAAVTCAESEGWGVRVVQRDDEEFMATTDYRSDRVNLVVENDVVTAVTVG